MWFGVLVSGVLVLSACGRPATSGLPPLANTYTPTAEISEQPARWAQVGLDACRLLNGDAVKRVATGAPFASGPHSCELPITLPGGVPERLVVALTAGFDHHNRSVAAPLTVGGLVAYALMDGPGTRTPELRTCDLHIPLSATTAIRVHGRAGGDDLTSGCAAQRAAAESIAGHLVEPLSAASEAPPTAIGRWDICRLLGKALQSGTRVRFGVGRDGIAGSACVTYDPNAGATWANTDLSVVAGPDPLREPIPVPAEGADPARAPELLTLAFGQVRKTPRERGCDLEWPVGVVEGAPADRAVLRVKLTRDNEPAACTTAISHAERIAKTLSVPPVPPPTPTTLGFRVGVPDEPMDAVCQLDPQAGPVDCRAPAEVVLPKQAEALIATYNTPEAPDIACALLGELINTATGQPGRTAARREHCQGATPDHGLLFTLRFYPASSDVWHRCDASGTTTIAGHTMTVCSTGNARRELMIPTSPDSPLGMIRIAVAEGVPRGISAPVPLKSDQLTVVDRMAETVIARYSE